MKYEPYNLQDVYDSEARELFTVISTFAGGGGSSTGYRLAGGKLLAINEFVEEAQRTYSANYPTTPILPGDIKDLSAEEVLETADIKPRELDIFDGSPPCSAFSVAGAMCSANNEEEYTDIFGNKQTRKIKSSHDDAFNKTKNYSDGKTITNIEDLFFEFLRIAETLEPKVIVAENVKGLTMAGAKEYLNKILHKFEELGYLVSYKVLNAARLEVAQSRERIIFIAVREDVAASAGLNYLNISTIFPDEVSGDIKKERHKFISCGEAIEGLVQDVKENERLTEHFLNSSAWKKCAINMPINQDKVLNGCDYHPTGSYFNVKRACETLPSPTITASSTGAVHWCETRKFNIDEMKRIQSLPDDFILTGKHEKQAERIGRMVPPKMMKAIAASIYEKVLKPYKENL